ncbi:hypothetical protein Val02_90930 [Virgisporangium aliadipatigenens]|uniref:Uncharacterized protein n=1 Tax=Virgisporangium aliadipatigenens TaxID=741659 RepID=A0A8J3YX87_9ACTN|nr:hypothetical protein [Virgisporangium aliadipatigenens]GIJ52207.1 hypothetical protein Val02_90930 [Virgisporangium aliadipatigenens]
MLTSTLSTTAAPPFTPVGYLAEGVRTFSGRPHDETVYPFIRMDPGQGRAVANAYIAAPRRDTRAFDAYAALCRETVEQYHFLIGRIEFGGLGVAVRVVDDDPYSSAEAMVEDLHERRLRVFASAASGNPHPYLSDGVNDMFRAVHDAFGHAASGRGFDPHGEEAAWLKHSAMYSAPARRALATEIRGQTCALIFYGRGEFPEQKAALLPRWFSDRRSVHVRRDGR